MKKLFKGLSAVLALVMVVVAVPIFASADNESSKTYYLYSENFMYDWGGCGVSPDPYPSDGQRAQPILDAYGTKWLNGETDETDNKNSMKLGMKKLDTSVNEGVTAWNIGKQSWRSDETRIADISDNGVLHFQIKITGLDNAKDVKVFICDSSYGASKTVSIPNGANITADNKYHDVYIPIAYLKSDQIDFTKKIIAVRFVCLNTEAESYVYVRNIDFRALNAISVKTARDGEGTKLTWAVANDPAVQNTIAGYKVYRDGTELADVDSTVTAYTDTVVLSEGRFGYIVVPYKTENDNKIELTEYKSDKAYVDVEKTGYYKVWDPKASEYSLQWNENYYNNYYKCPTTKSDKDFIPADTFSMKCPMGSNVTTDISTYFEVVFSDENKNISEYVKSGLLNMFVYIDVPDEEKTQYDRNIDISLVSKTNWGESDKKSNAGLPLNKWVKLSIPISEFTGNYDKTNMYSVRLKTTRSDIQNCDIYIQGVSITMPEVSHSELVVKYSDSDEVINDEVYPGVKYNASMTLYNNSADEVKPVYIVAVYKNDLLISLYKPTLDATTSKNEKTYTVNDILIPEDTEGMGDTYKIKGFMFDNLSNIKPISQR